MHKIIKKILYIISITEFIKTDIKKTGGTIIDIGCGKGLKYLLESGSHIVGIDIFIPYIKKVRGLYHEVIIADARYLPIKYNSCDITIANQVIEHLDKDNNFITSFEKISKKKVIITTPVGINIKTHHEDDNPYQKHRSAWYPQDLINLGYTVYGFEGARFLRGERSIFRYDNNFLYSLSYIFSIITQLFTFKYVKLAYQMLCIKNLNSTSKK